MSGKVKSYFEVGWLAPVKNCSNSRSFTPCYSSLSLILPSHESEPFPQRKLLVFFSENLPRQLSQPHIGPLISKCISSVQPLTVIGPHWSNVSCHIDQMCLLSHCHQHRLPIQKGNRSCLHLTFLYRSILQRLWKRKVWEHEEEQSRGQKYPEIIQLFSAKGPVFNFAACLLKRED